MRLYLQGYGLVDGTLVMLPPGNYQTLYQTGNSTWRTVIKMHLQTGEKYAIHELNNDGIVSRRCYKIRKV